MSQNQEINLIKRKCIIILNFIAHKSPNPFIDEVKQILDTHYNKQNLRGLRGIMKEIDYWAKQLPSADKEELEKVLALELNLDPENEELSDLKKIKKIIAQNKIKNQKEYRLLQDRADLIYDDDSKQDELKKINILLAQYHKANNS